MNHMNHSRIHEVVLARKKMLLLDLKIWLQVAA